MKIYFVRHGQSEGNVGRYHQSKFTELTDHGKKQAELVAERCTKINFDILLASDYVRAHDTAKAIAKACSKDIEVCELLRETRSPTVFHGKTHADPTIQKIKKLLHQNFHNSEWRHSDEENFYDMKKRATDFLAFLEKRTEKSFICVAHGNIIKVIVLTLLFGDSFTPDNYLSSRLDKMAHANTGITLCEYVDVIWKLKTWNDHAHLG